MTALSKFLVLLEIFLLAYSGDAFMNLSSATGNLVWVNHLTQFDESMSNQKNEPSIELTCKLTNGPMIHDLSSNKIIQPLESKGFPLNTSADASQPTVAKTSEGDKNSEGVDNVIHAHKKNIVAN